MAFSPSQRTIAIGDIHGCSAALDALLEVLQPGERDTVVTLGDYIDRGPDSRGVIDRLLTLKRECVLVPLKGNHEIMLLESRMDPMMEKSWRHYGGDQTLRSYAPTAMHPRLRDIPAAHWEFFEHQLLDYWEADMHFFVHANASPDIALAHQPPVVLFWEHLTEEPEGHYSGRTMVCGHTAQRSGLPFIRPGIVCLDTWAHGGGWLTAWHVEADTFLQTNQKGELRRWAPGELKSGWFR